MHWGGELCAGNAISTLITEVEIASGSPGTKRGRRKRCMCERGERERAGTGEEKEDWKVLRNNFPGGEGFSDREEKFAWLPTAALRMLSNWMEGSKETRANLRTNIHYSSWATEEGTVGYRLSVSTTHTHKPTAALLPRFYTLCMLHVSLSHPQRDKTAVLVHCKKRAFINLYNHLRIIDSLMNNTGVTSKT